ncbi:MAG TPA: hypothetical protein VMS09_08835 [Paenibacillus sp.]|nr:hypothetical protein [Paenibacillus sp.]HUC92119.1 hypothetical protein [Paenibacillus sp.]
MWKDNEPILPSGTIRAYTTDSVLVDGIAYARTDYTVAAHEGGPIH